MPARGESRRSRPARADPASVPRRRPPARRAVVDVLAGQLSAAQARQRCGAGTGRAGADRRRARAPRRPVGLADQPRRRRARLLQPLRPARRGGRRRRGAARARTRALSLLSGSRVRVEDFENPSVMQKPSDAGIPVLTEVVYGLEDEESPGYPSRTETLVAELQTRLASETFALAEDLMRSAFAEMEAHLFEQISRRLREKLPDLIDSILREHLAGDDDEPPG